MSKVHEIVKKGKQMEAASACFRKKGSKGKHASAMLPLRVLPQREAAPSVPRACQVDVAAGDIHFTATATCFRTT